MGRYYSTIYEKREALKQVSKRSARSRSRRSPDALLGPIMAYLQICLQYLVARRMYVPQFAERVSRTSRYCSLQKLHSDFDNAPRKEKNEKRSNDMEVETQLGGYLEMVSRRFEISLWICEGSHRSARAVH